MNERKIRPFEGHGASKGDSGWPPSDGTSGILMYLAKTPSGHESIFPHFFTVHFDEESGASILADQAGFIPTEDEFWSIVDLLARAYRGNPDERIKAHNRANYERAWGEKARWRQTGAPLRKQVARRKEPGHVYVLAGGGCHKIGRTKDLRRRVEQLAVQLPFEVALVCSLKSDDPKTLEAELHERFANKRLNGEWFDLSAEDVAYITGLGSPGGDRE